MSDNQYDSIIQSASTRYGVPVPLIKGIIKAESNFNPNANSGYSVGLMQVSPSTAGMSSVQLLDPTTNIMAGTSYLAACLRKTGVWSNGISQYNGGYRPNLGYGAPYTGTSAIRVCNAWKPNAPTTGRNIDRDCLPGNIVTVYPGQLANQKYVDTVLRWYQVYAQESAPPVSDTAPIPVNTATVVPPMSSKVVALVIGILGTILGLGYRRGRN